MRKNLLWMSLTIPLILSLLGVNTVEVAAVDIHDIAVISVTPSPTSARLGELVNITVVVKNNGTVDETFNTTVYYDTTAIDTKTVQNLTAGLTTPLTFTWNTNTTDVREEIYATNKKEKTYTINATASTVPGETNTGDNTLLSTVKIMSYYITVFPQSIVDPNLIPGKNFTVSIYTDYNGTDVWGWQFALSYNPLVLNGTEVTNGDLITEGKNASIWFKEGDFFNNLGKLSVTEAWFNYPPTPVPTTYGPGILANVTFTVVGTGDSNITLEGKDASARVITKLSGWDYTPPPEIGKDYPIITYSKPDWGHLLDGFFRNTAAPVIHDIAVTSVTPFPTSVEAGEFVNITVVVENQGTVNESVGVKVYRDYEPGLTFWVIGTGSITDLENGTSTTLTFTWDTTDAPAGNHTVTAKAEDLPGETETGDNTRQSEKIVTIKAREEQPLPILLIIGIVAVVVLVVAVYAVRRR